MRCLAYVVCLLAGCSHLPQPDPTRPVGEGLVRTLVYIESAGASVEKAVPHADAEGKTHLQHASSDLDQAAVAAVQAKDANERTAQQLAEVNRDHQKLQGEWYVKWGRRIERALWIIGISWLLMGIASIVLGLGNPLSWTWRIGKEITRLLPLMNAFSWIRDWLLRRRS